MMHELPPDLGHITCTPLSQLARHLDEDDPELRLAAIVADAELNRDRDGMGRTDAASAAMRAALAALVEAQPYRRRVLEPLADDLECYLAGDLLDARGLADKHVDSSDVPDLVRQALAQTARPLDVLPEGRRAA